MFENFINWLFGRQEPTHGEAKVVSGKKTYSKKKADSDNKAGKIEIVEVKVPRGRKRKNWGHPIDPAKKKAKESNLKSKKAVTKANPIGSKKKADSDIKTGNIETVEVKVPRGRKRKNWGHPIDPAKKKAKESNPKTKKAVTKAKPKGRKIPVAKRSQGIAKKGRAKNVTAAAALRKAARELEKTTNEHDLDEVTKILATTVEKMEEETENSLKVKKVEKYQKKKVAKKTENSKDEKSEETSDTLI
jgi:hypothetical protein